MTTKSEHVPGRFCWIELGTTDPEQAKGFYTGLFGWKTRENDAGDQGLYTIFTLGDAEIGGMYRLPPEQLDQGIPSHWLSYVAVEDADALAGKVAELGGTLVMGPMDVMDLGRMAVVMDPTGAVFALWQAKAHRGAGVEDEIGSTCWFELMTKDPATAGEFYRGLFGWDPVSQAMGPMKYTLLMHGDRPAGGMMQITEEMGELPSHWMIYFSVEDCEADVERTGALGGNVCVPPMDVPEVGRFSTLLDPTGAAFSIIKLSEPPSS